MKRMITAAAVAAGSLALLGGALVAGGAPALALPTTNQAWGADATGTITLSPVALATPSFNPAVASNANIPGLLSTTTITDRASTGGAEARVNGPTVLTLPGNGSLLTLPANNSLTTSGLRSWCEVDGSDVYGGATIFSGAIMQIGYTTIALPQKPAPNTVITLPNSAGTITLNYQNTTAGLHTFEAIQAVLGGQTVDLGVSQCFHGVS
ncbi:MAG: hypothetical protein ACHP9Z_26995 [Streptosporangiales bacterium]